MDPRRSTRHQGAMCALNVAHGASNPPALPPRPPPPICRARPVCGLYEVLALEPSATDSELKPRIASCRRLSIPPRGRIRIAAAALVNEAASVLTSPRTGSFRPRPERVACQRAGFERPVADGPFTAVRVVGAERGRARGRSRQARRRVRGRERLHRMPQVRAHRTDDILDRNPVWMRQGGGPMGGWEGSSRRRGGSLPGAVHPFREQTRRASTARARRREAVEGRGERRRRHSRQGGELVALRNRRVAREESREGRSHRVALPPRQGVERWCWHGGRGRGGGGGGGGGGVRGIRVGGGNRREK